MKKLIYILLLFFACNQPEYVYSQIVITEQGALNASTTNASAFGFGPSEFDAGKLYLFVAITTGATNPGTITATTLTWTEVASIGNSTRRIQIFRCMPTANVTGESVSLGSFGSTTTGTIRGLLEITGVVTTGTNGADAIVQSSSSTGAPGTNPFVNLPNAINNPRNAVIGFFTNDTNPFAGTAETDWVELFDSGYDTPTAGGYAVYRYTTTDNTINVTRASSNYLGFGLELKAASRRVMGAQ